MCIRDSKQAFPGMEVIAWVDQVHHVKASVDWEAVTASVIESNICLLYTSRCV